MRTDGVSGGLMGQAPGALTPMQQKPEGARVVLATGNDHKLGEVRDILRSMLPEFKDEWIVGLKDLGLRSPVEDGVTFEENALLKARSVLAASGMPTMADDSGIVVDVLGKAPGVFSARWAGGHGDDEANIDLLLDQLADVPDHHRGARFECAAVLVAPGGIKFVETGVVTGHLLRSRRGEGGFGYDPIFQPDGHSRSLAELPAKEKNAISHRGAAFRALAEEFAAIAARAG